MKRWVGLTVTVVALAMLSSQSSLAAGDHDEIETGPFAEGVPERLRRTADRRSTTGRGEFEVRISP